MPPIQLTQRGGHYDGHGNFGDVPATVGWSNGTFIPINLSMNMLPSKLSLVRLFKPNNLLNIMIMHVPFHTFIFHSIG